MPIEGTKTTKSEDGVDKDAYTVAFTNGALGELEELKDKLHLDNLEAVIKLSIALLRRLEESNDGQKRPDVS